MVLALLTAQALAGGIVLKGHPLAANSDYWGRVRLGFLRSAELRRHARETAVGDA